MRNIHIYKGTVEPTSGTFITLAGIAYLIKSEVYGFKE